MKNLRLFAAAASLILIAVGTSWGAVWTVGPGGGVDYSKIQDAIDASTTVAGDTIEVATGQYQEQVVVNKADLTIQAMAGNAPQIITTDGNYNTLVSIEATGVTLDGLALISNDGHSRWTGVDVHKQNATIRNCDINSPYNGWPNFGVFAFNPNDTDKASGLQILDCYFYAGEDAIQLGSGSFHTLEDVVVKGNTIAYWEKGIYGKNKPLSNLNIEGNTFVGGSFCDYAIGLSQHDSRSGQIVNNLIYDWTDKDYTITVGNQDWGDPCDIDILNNTIVNNDEAGSGSRGAIYIEGDAGGYVGKIKNNIIVSNADYGIYSDNPQSGAVIDYNDVWNNGPGGSLNYGPHLSAGASDISTDPLFVDLGADDFHLQSTSPCIGAGLTIPRILTDIEENPRKSPPDMGAFETSSGPPPPVIPEPGAAVVWLLGGVVLLCCAAVRRRRGKV